MGFSLAFVHGPSACEPQSTAGRLPEGTQKTPPSFLTPLLLTINKQVSNRSRQPPKKKTFDILVHITWKGNAVVSAEKHLSKKAIYAGIRSDKTAITTNKNSYSLDKTLFNSCSFQSVSFFG